MSLPRIATREEWPAARKELLAQEKNLTRQRDALSTKRRDLPMVEIVKDYQFDGPDGRVRLIDIFEGRSQLIIYHFMFHPEWEDGCPSCTAGTDELSRGFMEHLHVRDGRVFHTYSQYARALECTGGSYYFLDLTALGRQEEWERPAGRSESARSATPDFAS